MKAITAAKYVEGVESIYVEQPVYEKGHDGDDGKCDCIGMCRGGLERGGAEGITNMRGTNQAARKTIRDLQELKSESALLVGDVVLKTRDKDDPDMPLPDKYRKGGSEYDERWGETNFTHIGTVTGKNPLEITHMTSPTAKKDKSIKGWGYFGELPWVQYEAAPEPPPEPEPWQDPGEPDIAVVVAESGNSVKMRAKPTQSCDMYWDVPIGSEVIVDEWDAKTDKKGQKWSKITWNTREGYMMTEFLRDEGEETEPGDVYTVHIPFMPKYKAEALVKQYPGSYMTTE